MLDYKEIIKGVRLNILNYANGAHEVVLTYAQKCLLQFQGQLNGVIMGSAYGGEVETMAKLWKGRGKAYGYDVFEAEHPKHLAVKDEGFAVDCMDLWYEKLGTERLAYDFQRKILDEEGLDNAILVKGEVHKDSCKDIPYINLAFLDMDFIVSMKTGYEAVVDKIVEDGYLFIHDAFPYKGCSLPKIHNWVFQDLLRTDVWAVEGIWPKSLLVGLRKKGEI